MAKLDNLRRILSEDFPKDSRETISLLAEILNPFMGQINDAFSNKINFDNLNQQVISFKIITDADGNPIKAGGTSTTSKIKLDRNVKVIGVYAIKSVNQTDSTNYPTANPFISFSSANQILTINKITGLQTSEEYLITALVIYDS